MKARLCAPYALLGASGVAAWNMNSTPALVTSGVLVAVLGVATNVEWLSIVAKGPGGTSIELARAHQHELSMTAATKELAEVTAPPMRATEAVGSPPLTPLDSALEAARRRAIEKLMQEAAAWGHAMWKVTESTPEPVIHWTDDGEPMIDAEVFMTDPKEWPPRRPWRDR